MIQFGAQEILHAKDSTGYSACARSLHVQSAARRRASDVPRLARTARCAEGGDATWAGSWPTTLKKF